MLRESAWQRGRTVGVCGGGCVPRLLVRVLLCPAFQAWPPLAPKPAPSTNHSGFILSLAGTLLPICVGLMVNLTPWTEMGPG